MAGQVKHVEHPVAHVNHIAFVQITRERCRGEAIRGKTVTGIRKCGKQFAGDPGAGTGIVEVRCGMDGGIAVMPEPRFKFMGAADVIEVAMAANRRYRPFAELDDFRLERLEPHAAINQQIAVAAVDEPHVTPHPRRHMRFMYAADTTTHILDLIPVRGNRNIVVHLPTPSVIPAKAGIQLTAGKKYSISSMLSHGSLRRDDELGGGQVKFSGS